VESSRRLAFEALNLLIAVSECKLHWRADPQLNTHRKLALYHTRAREAQQDRR